MLSRIALAFVSGIALTAVASTAQAQVSTYTDAANDIDPGISTAGGTLDILGMEISNTASDIVFRLTVNGNISSTDWGKFMVGIARVGGSGTTTGNGWNRPINMNAASGMTNWLGGWVDGGGGAESYVFQTSAFSRVGATWNGDFPGSFAFAAAATSSVTWTVSLASMGLSVGDTFLFDAYSSGGGGGDSAIDALANPNVSVTGWGGPYTSGGSNPIYSYTVVPAPGAVALLGLAGLIAGRRRRA